MNDDKKKMEEECEAYYKDGGVGACGSDREDFYEKDVVDIPDCLDIRFYRCEVCGQIVAVIGTDGNPLMCCMRDMQLLEAGTVDASAERHVPVFKRHGHKVIVKVGEVLHPMTKEHHIEWICLVTDKGIQWKYLASCDEAIATFRIQNNEHVAAVYAYCNLHKLWKCC